MKYILVKYDKVYEYVCMHEIDIYQNIKYMPVEYDQIRHATAVVDFN